MFTCNILSILEKLLWQELFIVLVLQLRSGICLLSCINPSRCVPHTSAPCSVPGRLTDKDPIPSAAPLPSGFLLDLAVEIPDNKSFLAFLRKIAGYREESDL